MADDSASIDTLSSYRAGQAEEPRRAHRAAGGGQGRSRRTTSRRSTPRPRAKGFDTKILRKVVRLRKADAAKRQEEEALIELYITAIGGL